MASASHTPLTTLIISPSDLKRARREVETVDDFLHQAGLRQGGKSVKMPQTSRLVEGLVSDSGTNLLQNTDRAQLISYLSDLVDHAPVLHFSFASEPSAAFMVKLIVWLRTNIHPQVLVHLGLQPSIAAGCVVRTANKQFDFSLTQAFEKQRELLVASLIEVEKPVKQATADPVVPEEASPAEQNSGKPAEAASAKEKTIPVSDAK
jgi:F0F1-type ATP synthase delta subunit